MNLSLLAHPTPTTTQLYASVMLDISSIVVTLNVYPLPLQFLTVPPTHTSTESVALVMLVSSNNPSTHVLLVHQEPPGMVRSVLPMPPILLPVHLVMSTTPTLVSVNLKLPHVVTMLSSTEPLAFVLLTTTGSAEYVRSVLMVLYLTVHSALLWLFLPL